MTIAMPSARIAEYPDIDFDAVPNKRGMGKIIVDGKTWELPALAVEQLERWRNNQDDPYDRWVD